MPNSLDRIGYIWIRLIVLSFSAGLAGCALYQPAVLEKSQQRVRTLEAERDLLQGRIETREKQMAGLQLESLEKDDRIQELEASLRRRDHELQQARDRLQRVETRIHSLTGPAQAAATIAEADAAYQVSSAKGEVASATESNQDVRMLLDAATAAYEAADYAGAADLGDQVIRRLSGLDSHAKPDRVGSAKLPERPLANPLVFRVRMNSHLRRGPGMGFASRAVLRAETEVLGLATRGRWVKIRGPGGVQGWIYRKLLAAPN